MSRVIKISEFRQAWIIDLRRDISDYIGAAQRWFRKYDELNDPDLGSSERGRREGAELFPIANEALVILRRIKLRLNPRANRDKAEDDAFLRSLDDLLNPGKLDEQHLEPSWHKLADQTVGQAREILKREWEMTTHPIWRWKCVSGAPRQVPLILIVIGLLVTTVGAAWAAASGIMSKQIATELASTKWDMNEDLRRSLIRQSRDARNGLILVGIGSILQIVGVIMQAGSARKP